MGRSTGKRATLDSNAIAVIGEGITEQYYLQSIPNVKAKITPKLPQHSTGNKFLEDKIKECIDNGYSNIFVLIDMDNKTDVKDRVRYRQIKDRFHNKTFKNASRGTQSTIIFFENERCLEIWFLFHFKNTTAQFLSQNELIREIKRYCAYEKTEKFFLSTKGLHQYFTKNGGDLEMAKLRSESSIKRKDEEGVDYTYSEMKLFFDLVQKKDCD
ncbi:hypothetical protein Palpr_1851 [Paludibacter propionicigenes WB4]|uniref:RloB-like protein n=1 Tax=Paludibacter propionicigenes (strain DSM 17365 / JCM 13257 / WB4) TaxID=694427 RepID=E4T5J6_PALPW|nr:RloB domain-containing protein [Paludibacter propionicigenes]ADQ79990.1 hypothetical protein Palpr_1851 [Paludibacter propionicigenes WB4]